MGWTDSFVWIHFLQPPNFQLSPEVGLCIGMQDEGTVRDGNMENGGFKYMEEVLERVN